MSSKKVTIVSDNESLQEYFSDRKMYYSMKLKMQIPYEKLTKLLRIKN